jgi:CrcB protein
MTVAGPAEMAEEARLRCEVRRRELSVLSVIAIGGAMGACARYEAEQLWPTDPRAFPWTTLGINAVGCLIIGVFLVAVTEMWSAHFLLRPFFGTGVLGGFTTFSTYCADIERLLREDRSGVALAYLAVTVVAAMVAVTIGVAAARRALVTRRQ